MIGLVQLLWSCVSRNGLIYSCSRFKTLSGMVGPFLLVLLALASVRATVKSCLYCSSDPDHRWYDHRCASGSADITRKTCTVPYTAGCVVFTLTGAKGPYTYRDCCHGGTGDRWACSKLPESYNKTTMKLEQTCHHDDCNLGTTKSETIYEKGEPSTLPLAGSASSTQFSIYGLSVAIFLLHSMNN